MKACIMCGGEGTRLRPLTLERPKPLIPLLNRPSVVHLVEHLSVQGFNDIVITLGYRGNDLEEALGDGRVYGVHIEYVHEKEKLGTAGGVKNAQDFFGDEPFMVIGGDHVMDLDLREMFRSHLKGDAIVTIGLLPIEDPREYGIADMDVNNRIHRFLEKPSAGEIFSNLASTGIYACNPEIFDWIPPGEYDFAKNLFPALMEGGERINGYLVRGKWTDIGNPRSYREASKWMLEKLPGTKIAGHLQIKDARVTGPIELSYNVSMGSNTALVGPIVIGENTTIGDNVLIGPYTSIGSNCTIEDNVRIFSSFLFGGIHIGQDTVVSGSIIDNDTQIGKNCFLETGTVIGPRVSIKNNATIHSNVRIWADLVVEQGETVSRDMVDQESGE